MIAKAQEVDALLLSLNGDFANVVTYSPAKYKGIIALQVRNHPEIIPQLLIRLKDYLSAHQSPILAQVIPGFGRKRSEVSLQDALYEGG